MSLTLSDQIQKKREGITLKNSTEFTALEAKDIDYVLHCHTNHNKHREVGPILIERGEGVFVYDNHGKKYLEGMSGMWCSGLGFSEKRLGEAAKNNTIFCLSITHLFTVRRVLQLNWQRNW